VGAALIHRFHWVIFILGAFLVYTGIKLIKHDESVDPEHSWVLKLARRWLPVARGQHGERFFVREMGRFCVTPLFLVLLVVESTDVAFAVDSVPAIFGITKDPFIVFTSNIFAVLGLRALYFLLAGVMGMFRYLRFGLAAILVFVGLKMLFEVFAEPWFANLVGPPPPWLLALAHIAPWVSLLVVVSLLGIAILASIIAARREGVEELPGEGPHDKAPPELQVAPRASDEEVSPIRQAD